MKYINSNDIALSARILGDLSNLAKENDIEKIILFGSRASGDNQAKSDVDIAVYGCRYFTSSYFDV